MLDQSAILDGLARDHAFALSRRAAENPVPEDARDPSDICPECGGDLVTVIGRVDPIALRQNVGYCRRMGDGVECVVSMARAFENQAPPVKLYTGVPRRTRRAR